MHRRSVKSFISSEDRFLGQLEAVPISLYFHYVFLRLPGQWERASGRQRRNLSRSGGHGRMIRRCSLYFDQGNSRRAAEIPIVMPSLHNGMPTDRHSDRSRANWPKILRCATMCRTSVRRDHYVRQHRFRRAISSNFGPFMSTPISRITWNPLSTMGAGTEADCQYHHLVLRVQSMTLPMPEWESAEE
jgi:hypothetical protein